MLAYLEEDEQARLKKLGRYHPWTDATNIRDARPRGSYVDFKGRPELIRPSLEDLPNLAGGPAGEAVVDFIAWANGPTSVFETNDFGIRPLRENDSTNVSPKKLEQCARITVFFRDLQRNTERGDLVSFAQQMEDRLKRIDVGFSEACWGWSMWPHLFLALGDATDPDAEGDVILYSLWAWGDDGREVQDHIVRAFANLRQALTQA